MFGWLVRFLVGVCISRSLVGIAMEFSEEMGTT